MKDITVHYNTHFLLENLIKLKSFNRLSWNVEDLELIISKLIQKEPNVLHHRYKNNETLLHLAVAENAFQIVKLLLEHGAPVNCWSNKNHTPLHIAVDLQNFEVTRILLEYGAYIDTNCDCNETPFVYAIRLQDPEIVNLLLKYKPNLNYVSIDLLPLQNAVMRENESIVIHLLQAGANVNCTEEENFTPLHFAVPEGNIRMMKILIAYGANLNARNAEGNTPLLVLLEYVLFYKKEYCLLQFEEILSYLLESGADINAANNFNNTMLHIVATAGNIKIARILLEYGAAMNVLNDELKSPLSIAVSEDNEEMVELFLNYNSFINFEEHYLSPLHCVSDTGNVTILNMFLEHNPDVDNLIYNSATPLIRAIEKNKVGIIKRFLDFGANIDFKIVDQVDREVTPLIAAIASRNIEVLQLLFTYGADVNKYCRGYSPLHFALDIKHEGIFNLILEQKPNIHANSPDGTPLQFAIECGDSFVKKLLDLGADINFKVMPDNVSLLKYSMNIENNSVLDVLLMKVIQLKVSNMYIIPEVLEDFNKVMISRKSCYEVELEKLKSKVIHPNHRITVYDISMQSLDQFSAYLRNTNIRNTLKLNQYDSYFTTFPSFVAILNRHINEGIYSAEVFEESYKLLRGILREARNGGILPEEITMQITNFLKVREMKFFLNQFKNVKFQDVKRF